MGIFHTDIPTGHEHEVASSEDGNYIVNGAFKESVEGQRQKAPCMAEENEHSRGRLTCEIQPEPMQERKRECDKLRRVGEEEMKQ